MPVDATWEAGTRIQVYEDRGTGTVDYTRPLLGRPLEVFPGQVAATVLLARRVSDGTLGDGRPLRRQGGLGERSSAGGLALIPPPSYVDVTVSVRTGYGMRKFGVKAFNAAGIPQGTAAVELEHFVSGTDPRPVERFAFDSFDGGTRRVRFTLE